jgi:hypothetical protein
MSDLLARHIAEQNRRDRETPRQFVRALLASDAKALVASLGQLDDCFDGWRRAFRQCVKLESIPADMKHTMLELWRHHGDHIRNEVRDDMALVKALRVLLPAYTGPRLALYWGDSAWNRRRRTYGLSWSASQAVAEAFADGLLWRSCRGGASCCRPMCRQKPSSAPRHCWLTDMAKRSMSLIVAICEVSLCYGDMAIY